MTYAWRPATRSIFRALTTPSLPLQPRVDLIHRARTRLQLRAFHAQYNPQLEDQTATLSDGRKIGFAEYGDSSGTPAFFFHGAPGSRYDGLGYDAPARKLGVRIICPDRPGHGLSSPFPGRTLSSYARDISELAARLKLGPYHVFGQSGGGPYAVACAYASPKDELLNATVVAGMGHPDQITVREAGWYTVLALGLHARFPGAMTRFMDWWYPPSFFANDEKVRRALRRMYKLLRAEDRALMEEPKAEPAIVACLRAAFAQGSAGTLGDSLIYYGPWDFELRDVKRRVQLIFGDKDNRTPLVFGKYYEEHLRDAELWELKDCSHFTIAKYLDEIMARVVGVEVPKKEKGEASVGDKGASEPGKTEV